MLLNVFVSRLFPCPIRSTHTIFTFCFKTVLYLKLYFWNEVKIQVPPQIGWKTEMVLDTMGHTGGSGAACRGQGWPPDKGMPELSCEEWEPRLRWAFLPSPGEHSVLGAARCHVTSVGSTDVSVLVGRPGR